MFHGFSQELICIFFSDSVTNDWKQPVMCSGFEQGSTRALATVHFIIETSLLVKYLFMRLLVKVGYNH